jgi:hypothetical protein
VPSTIAIRHRDCRPALAHAGIICFEANKRRIYG